MVFQRFQAVKVTGFQHLMPLLIFFSEVKLELVLEFFFCSALARVFNMRFCESDRQVINPA